MISIQWLMIWHSYFIDYWAIRLCAFVIPLHYLALTHFLSISACGIFLLKSLFPIINLFFTYEEISSLSRYRTKIQHYLPRYVCKWFIFLIQNLLMKGCVIFVWNGNTTLHKFRHIQKLHRQPYLPQNGK